MLNEGLSETSTKYVSALLLFCQERSIFAAVTPDKPFVGYDGKIFAPKKDWCITLNWIGVVVVSFPLVPVKFIVYKPGITLSKFPKVAVKFPSELMELLDKFTFAFAGRPDTEKTVVPPIVST